MAVMINDFGSTHEGEKVKKYTLSRGDMSVEILDLGATICDIILSDSNGKKHSMVLGYDDLEAYLASDGYLGAVVGRVGNRIAKGKFTLDGREYSLYCNNGENHLHGGRCGFDKKIWQAEPEDNDEPSLLLSLVSPDGDEGYPGELSVSIRYTLTARRGLRIEYSAKTDAPTVLNLTNHSYFNLSDNRETDVLSHELMLAASHYLPTDSGLIPTGEIKSVEGTPFDFRTSKAVGKDLDLGVKALELAGGYDHCMVFDSADDAENTPRAILRDTESGREMRLYTDRPCAQFYTGNFLETTKHLLHGGQIRFPRAALCLETQSAPDTVNQPNFAGIGDVVLRPGELYTSFTEYAFS